MLWLVAAALLWRTTVPGNLRLPHVDERAAFGAHVVGDARRYERLLDVVWIGSTIAALVVYVAVLWRARTLALRLRLGAVNAGIVLGVVTFTAVWGATLPFTLVATWWGRRHGISRESYLGTLGTAWLQLLGVALVATVVLAVVLGLARRLGRRWWIVAAPLLGAVLLVLQFATPYLATLNTHGVRSATLRSEIRALEVREHAGTPPVRIDDVSGRTRTANAFSVGIGPSERVVLWNTLLDGRFDPHEVRFVIAHELGHLARNHVARGVAWFTLLVLPVLAVTALLVDVRRPAAVPAALLVIAVLQLALLPVRNAIARRYEAEADWIGLKATRDPRAAAGLFEEFVRTSLQDPSPPEWAHVLLDDHPTLLRRVEMARAWAARNP